MCLIQASALHCFHSCFAPLPTNQADLNAVQICKKEHDRACQLLFVQVFRAFADAATNLAAANDSMNDIMQVPHMALDLQRFPILSCILDMDLALSPSQPPQVGVAFASALTQGTAGVLQQPQHMSPTQHQVCYISDNPCMLYVCSGYLCMLWHAFSSQC